MSAAVRRFEPFRRHKSSEPSWYPVIAIGLLAAFDIGIVGYLILSLWRLA